MVDADNRQLSEVRPDKTPFIVVLLDSHSVLHMVRLPAAQDCDTAVSFFLCTIEPCLITKRLERFGRELIRLQLGFLQAKHIGKFPGEPFGKSFSDGGTQSVYVVCDNLHISIVIMMRQM